MSVQMTYEDLLASAGRDLGRSRLVLLQQDRIDSFAEVSEDRQWIHVDPQRAATGPFGTTIAHGYLTLTVAGTLLGELLAVAPDVVLVNYGLERVRFISPVPAGSSVYVEATVSAVEETSRGARCTIDVVCRMEEVERPVCLAQAIVLASTAG